MLLQLSHLILHIVHLAFPPGGSIFGNAFGGFQLVFECLNGCTCLAQLFLKTRYFRLFRIRLNLRVATNKDMEEERKREKQRNM
jgi:hypothetical protein